MFRARLQRIAGVRWISLPRGVVEQLGLPPAEIRGSGQGWNAILRFGDEVDRVTLLPGKPGRVKFAVKVELLRAAGTDAPDPLEFSLAPDPGTREPDLPAELRRVLQQRPELAARWQQHSVARRRQVVRYILQAKSPDAQVRRAWIFLERLAETGALQADARK